MEIVVNFILLAPSKLNSPNRSLGQTRSFVAGSEKMCETRFFFLLLKIEIEFLAFTFSSRLLSLSLSLQPYSKSF